MRCLSCNKLLSDYEATRRYSSDNSFVDLCNECIGSLSPDSYYGRDDLYDGEEPYCGEEE